MFIIDRTAESIRQKKNPELLEKQLADAQSQLAQSPVNNALSGADTPEALKQATVNLESAMGAAQSVVQRAQRKLMTLGMPKSACSRSASVSISRKGGAREDRQGVR